MLTDDPPERHDPRRGAFQVMKSDSSKGRTGLLVTAPITRPQVRAVHAVRDVELEISLANLGLIEVAA